MTMKRRCRNLTEQDVQWVVNDLGELGVKIGNQFFFLYKGQSLEYKRPICNVDNGICQHDDGSNMMYRIVGKREFGETCKPECYDSKGYYKTGRYTEPLVFTSGLSFGAPEDGAWKPLPHPGRKKGGKHGT